MQSISEPKSDYDNVKTECAIVTNDSSSQLDAGLFPSEIRNGSLVSGWKVTSRIGVLGVLGSKSVEYRPAPNNVFEK